MNLLPTDDLIMMRLKYFAFCQREWTFLAKSLQLSFNYPDVTDGLNIFHLSPGFTIDSPSNESLRPPRFALQFPTVQSFQFKELRSITSINI